MKIKHQQDESQIQKNKDDPNLRRGRGRPRKFADFCETNNHTGLCLDATGEMFLRTEGRTGGPLDPFTCLSDSIEFLFGIPAIKHPIFDLMNKLSYKQTPREQVSIKDEDGN
jgi:hypothetical protein